MRIAREAMRHATVAAVIAKCQGGYAGEGSVALPVAASLAKCTWQRARLTRGSGVRSQRPMSSSLLPFSAVA